MYFCILLYTLVYLCYRLLAHAFDPHLDKKVPREFIVYAIPLGSLGQQLEEFFELTLNQELRNGAHKSFPHVTLCQYFKVGGATSGVSCDHRPVTN